MPLPSIVDYTVYLAGPMTGYEDHNYPAFESAATSLRGRGVRVVAPHELHTGWEDHPGAHTFEWYMKRDLEALLTRCNAIAVLPGWEESRGASIEVLVGKAAGYAFFDALTGEPIVTDTIDFRLTVDSPSTYGDHDV